MVRTRDTDDASEERRQKKKKKKPQSRIGLWIGLGVGAAVLLILILVGVIAVIMASNAGEPQAKGPPPKLDPLPPIPPIVQPKQEQFKDIGEKKRPSGAGNLRARIDRIERINELRNIGLFYQQYVLNFNRPPANAKDFTEFIKSDSPTIKHAIDEKYYFIVPNVRAGNAIVAYEFDPDTMGRHGSVRMGGQDAHEDLSSKELRAQLDAQGSQ
jgi:hypothetical protein